MPFIQKKAFFFSYIIFFVFCSTFARAQNYAVQVIPQLLPPYSLNLTDYYTGSREKLAVTLINRDLQKPMLQVRLRMSIESQNVVIRSRDNVYYPPIDLDPGIPFRISLGDLAPYFNINNLDFQGITRMQYQQGAKLPDGLYRFNFEAVEYQTGRVVSQKSYSMAWLSLSDPPLINLPRKGETIAFREPTNIIFNWTPRHMSSPNSAFNTQYEFSLVEIWDNGVAPESAFLSAQPLYQSTTNATTLLYGPGEPPLLPGKRYAWRVKAQAKDGADDYDLFRNQGYSEIYWFTQSADCKLPQNVKVAIKGAIATLSWDADFNKLDYIVEYREKDKAKAEWFSQKTTENRMPLYDLKPGKTYEYRIGGSCQPGEYVYADIQTLKTEIPSGQGTVNCGLEAKIDIANKTPIQTLNPGETILAGDFPVKLTEVRGNASFSGKGYITVPFIGMLNIAVAFNNIKVNTDRQLIDGQIVTVYDVTEGQVVDVSKVVEQVKGAMSLISDVLDRLIAKLKDPNITPAEIKKIIEEEQPKVESSLDKMPGITAKQKDAITSQLEDLKKPEYIASGNNEEAISRTVAVNEKIKDVGEALQQEQQNPTTTSPQIQELVETGITAGEARLYITPAGTPILLPKDAEPQFRYGGNVANGVLEGFILDKKIYAAKIPDKGASRFFMGYCLLQNDQYTDTFYEDKETYQSGKQKVMLLLRYNEDKACGVEYKEAEYTFSAREARALVGSLVEDKVTFIASYTALSTVKKVLFKGCTEQVQSSPSVPFITSGFSKSLSNDFDVFIKDENGSVKKRTAEEKWEETANTGSTKKAAVTYQLNNGKWQATVKLNAAAIQKKTGFAYKPTDLQATEDALNESINTFSKQFTSNNGTQRSSGWNQATDDGGSIYAADMSFAEGIETLTDVAISIYESSNLPLVYWKQDEAKYKSYPIHAPPTLTGVTDGAIEEITAIPQVVKLGLELATDKEKAIALWNSVKMINLESIKKVVVGTVKEKWDKYANSPDFVTYHELGRDGFQAASLLYGGFATKGKNLEEAVEEAAEQVEKKSIENLPSLVRQLLSKPTYKPLRSIFSTPNKTTTFIGKWDEVVDGQQNGLQKVFSELTSVNGALGKSTTDLNIYMQSGKFDNLGGFNILSIDNFSAKQAEFVQKIGAGQINNQWLFDDYIWEVYNKPWLENALQRGDDIIIWSDPINSRTGFYKRELDFIESKASQYGYDYKAGVNNGTFSK